MAHHKQENIPSLFVEVARKISEVYRYFSVKFPEEKEFWLSLSRDEEAHSHCAQKLVACIEKGDVSFEECLARNLTLTTIIQHIENLNIRAHEDTFSYFDALFFARDFERSLIVRDVFSSVPGLGKEEASLLAKLEDAATHHVQLLDDKWWQFRGSNSH